MAGQDDGTWFGNEPNNIITFEEKGANEVKTLQGQITNLDHSGGDQESDTIQAFGGRQITFTQPRSEFEVSMDVIFYDTEFAGMFMGQFGTGAGDEVSSSDTSNKLRITCWWAENPFQGDAETPPTSGEILRWVFKDARAVTWEPEIAADDHMQGTITFQTGASDKDGYGNIYKEWTSAQSTTALTAITGTTTTRYGGELTWTTSAWSSGY